ncbi:MAG: ABC transporter ATP-binding protein [Alteromonadaceae bacterium]|nr:ABC transporter ATP-binding protein [Alteromonadaceae bacterium]
MNLIKLENLSKTFTSHAVQTKAVNNVNLSIDSQDFITILGTSGSGKSTLLKVLGLLDRKVEGKIILNNVDVLSQSKSEIERLRKQYFGYIFQTEHLIYHLNVLDNVLLPFKYRRDITKAQAKEKAVEAIEKVGLGHRMKHRIQELSGGQCQRVSIARALSYDASILFADEPTGKLDDANTFEICELLADINKAGTTIVMVTHDERLCTYSNKVYNMSDGVLSGPDNSGKPV